MFHATESIKCNLETICMIIYSQPVGHRPHRWGMVIYWWGMRRTCILWLTILKTTGQPENELLTVNCLLVSLCECAYGAHIAFIHTNIFVYVCTYVIGTQCISRLPTLASLGRPRRGRDACRRMSQCFLGQSVCVSIEFAS